MSKVRMECRWKQMQMAKRERPLEQRSSDSEMRVRKGRLRTNVQHDEAITSEFRYSAIS